jgi:hypothetical protein
MWKVRTNVVPVTTGASGIIKKWLVQNRQLLPGHRSTIELQKYTLMSTVRGIGECWGGTAVVCCWDVDLLEDRHLVTKRQQYELNNNNNNNNNGVIYCLYYIQIQPDHFASNDGFWYD